MDTVKKKSNLLVRLIRKAKKDPEVRKLAFSIIRGVFGGAPVQERDRRGQALAISDWVRDNLHFVSDPTGIDIFEGHRWTLEAKAGDCDAHTVVLGGLLESVGIRSKVKVVSYDGSSYSHVYLEALGMPLDPTYNAPAGNEMLYVVARIFKV